VPSVLETTAIRKRVLELTDGVTVRIFRLVETVAFEAIRSGVECINPDSFDTEELALPLVAMTRAAETRLQRRGVG
jgi:glutamate formiminotransferase